MFLYLWVDFGLYVLNQNRHSGEAAYQHRAQGFAVINAVVLAKVMLVADDLKFADRFKDKPLIYPISIKRFVLCSVHSCLIC